MHCLMFPEIKTSGATPGDLFMDSRPLSVLSIHFILGTKVLHTFHLYLGLKKE